MNNNTLLIAYKVLIASSELNENIDPKIIQPLIKEVQEMRIQPLTGSRLFEKLKSAITEDNLAEDYKYLLTEFIHPVIIYNVLSDLPFRLNHRFTNIAVVNRTGENSNAINEQDLQKFSDYHKSRARWYADRLNDYLKANSEKFPEFLQSDKPEELRPRPGQYETGIYLG